jgi:hypothetical protein
MNRWGSRRTSLISVLLLLGIPVVIANGIVGCRLYPVYQMLVPSVLVTISVAALLIFGTVETVRRRIRRCAPGLVCLARLGARPSSKQCVGSLYVVPCLSGRPGWPSGRARSAHAADQRRKEFTVRTVGLSCCIAIRMACAADLESG